MVLHLALIHFEFIFVYGVRKCSNFILLQVAVQFSQHHLLKRLSLPHCIILASFVKNKVPIDVWVYFWAFYLVPLVYISVSVPVPYCFDDCSFVVWSPEGWFLQIHSSFLRLLWLFRVFCVSIWIVKYLCFSLVKYAIGNLMCWGLHWFCRLHLVL